MTTPLSKIETLIPKNSLKTKNKHYYIYSFDNQVEIAVGRNQEGNQQILDMFKSDAATEQKCWWFHLQSSTSAHAIIHELSDTCTAHKLQQAFEWVHNVLFVNNKNDLIFTRLTNVKCTKTKGLVTFKDEQYVSSIQWGVTKMKS